MQGPNQHLSISPPHQGREVSLVLSLPRPELLLHPLTRQHDAAREGLSVTRVSVTATAAEGLWSTACRLREMLQHHSTGGRTGAARCRVGGEQLTWHEREREAAQWCSSAPNMLHGVPTQSIWCGKQGQSREQSRASLG